MITGVVDSKKFLKEAQNCYVTVAFLPDPVKLLFGRLVDGLENDFSKELTIILSLSPQRIIYSPIGNRTFAS
jgi:hypothetical protein